VPPLFTSSVQNATATLSYDQNQAFRACRDAVVARTKGSEWISGTITAGRGPVTGTFDFGCSIDRSAARVRSVELNLR
jgi:hypothetical protein